MLNSRSSDLNLQPASGDLTLSFEFFMLLTLPLPHSYLSSSHASCLSGIPLYLDSMRLSEMMCQAKPDSCCASSLIPLRNGARFCSRIVGAAAGVLLPTQAHCQAATVGQIRVFISEGCKALVFS